MCGVGFGLSRPPLLSARSASSDGTEGSQAKGGGLRRSHASSPLLPAPLAVQTPEGSTVVPERGDMPELVVTALLAPSRLSLKLLRAVMWSLVFSAALVAAAIYGCIAFTHVLCRPRRGCCGRPRRTPPACLSDPVLGEHCFLTLKVSVRGAVGAAGVQQPRRPGRSGVSRAQTVESKSGSAQGWGKGSSLEWVPQVSNCASSRAPACACTTSPLVAAKGPSCCFCTASRRTGMCEAEGPWCTGLGIGGAWTTRSSRRREKGWVDQGEQRYRVQMGHSGERGLYEDARG